MSRFVLRSAETGDEFPVRNIVHTVLREYGFEPEPDGIDADLTDIVAHYHLRGGVFLVLVDDEGAIAGCGGLYPLNSEEAEIRKMYFVPAARGLGYGRLLLEALIAHARMRAFKRVVLETASHLTAAAVLYRQFGFVEVPRPHMAARCDVSMELSLGGEHA